MKKIMALLLGALFLTGCSSIQDLSIEDLFNKAVEVISPTEEVVETVVEDVTVETVEELTEIVADEVV